MSTFYDSPNDYRDYLKHYGVKGMHWGVRKAAAYDSLYYRAKYNNKKVQAFKDLKEGKTSAIGHKVKRAGHMVGHYGIDPWKKIGRIIGRDVRGWYRLLTGKTYRKTNEQEYRPAAERALNEIKDPTAKEKLPGMVQESISNNTAFAASNGTVLNRADFDAMIDYLDNVSLKEIERLNKK